MSGEDDSEVGDEILDAFEEAGGAILEAPQLTKGESAVRLFGSLEKKIRELIGGYGGLEAWARFLQQNLYIDGLAELTHTVDVEDTLRSTVSVLVDPQRTAKKTIAEMEAEAIGVIGLEEYVAAAEEMLALAEQRGINLKVNPVTTLLYAVYGRNHLEKAFVAAYQAMEIIMKFIAESLGRGSFKITDPALLQYLEELRSEGIKGDTSITIIEKDLLQLIFYGPLIGLPLERAQQIYRSGVSVLKWGTIMQTADASVAPLFAEARTEFTRLWGEFLEEMIPHTHPLVKHEEAEVRYDLIPRSPNGVYHIPFMVADEAVWAGGDLSGKIYLQPLEDFPMYVKQEVGAVTVALSRPGCGKTWILDAIMAESIFKKNYICFIPVADEYNQPILACMPHFPFNRRTEKISEMLRQLNIEPRGVPTLVLDILLPGDEDLLRMQTLTEFDRIIYVSDPSTFRFDFKILVDELKAIAEGYGFKRPAGIICVRRLMRRSRKEDIDLEIGRRILDLFRAWRVTHLSTPVRVVFDELAEIAPRQIFIAGGDTYALRSQLSSMLRMHRHMSTPIDASSQRIGEIIGDIRDLSDNIFFKEIPKQLKREQSQLEALLEMLDLEDPSQEEAVRIIMRRGLLRGTWLWFWWNRLSRRINLVQSVPPPFSTRDHQTTHLEHFRAYAKYADVNHTRPFKEIPVLLDLRSEQSGEEDESWRI